MYFARKALLVVITPLLPLLLFTTAFTYGLVQVAGSADSVKKIIAGSGLYSEVIPGALEQVKTVSEGGGEVALNDPVVRDAANKAFSPEFIKQSSNQVIDSIYAWLEGRTAHPDFNIDLSGPKAAFGTQIAQAAQTRAGSLPACTSAASAESFDVFNASCLPPGMSAVQAGDVAKLAVLNGEGFLRDTTISSAEIQGNKPGQSVFDNQLKQAPEQYQQAKRAPIYAAILAILVAGGIILLSPTWHRGLQRVGITMFITGLFMLVFAWGLNYAVHEKALPQIKIDNAVFESNIRSLVTNLTEALNKNYWIFGGVYSVLGAAAIAGVWYLGRGGKPDESKAAPRHSENPPPTKISA